MSGHSVVPDGRVPGSGVTSPEFAVVAGTTVRSILVRERSTVIALVRETYLAHQHGLTVNPDSYFLRFPDQPQDRIIALPGALWPPDGLAGIKWIASFPENIAHDLPRASAVLILNDASTGYPFACLEASTISSARTAASAALAVQVLRTEGGEPPRLGLFGAGVIARNICDYLVTSGFSPSEVVVHDPDEASTAALVEYLKSTCALAAEGGSPPRTLECDVVVFATTASAPHVEDVFRPGQLVLNISLRDLSVGTILSATNVLDDIEHCLKANTSPHLAEQHTGNRDFVWGTLSDVLLGDRAIPTDRPIVFSPFGLGVLDLAVGRYVYEVARRDGDAIEIPGFFGETTRLQEHTSQSAQGRLRHPADAAPGADR